MKRDLLIISWYYPINFLWVFKNITRFLISLKISPGEFVALRMIVFNQIINKSILIFILTLNN